MKKTCKCIKSTKSSKNWRPDEDDDEAVNVDAIVLDVIVAVVVVLADADVV